MCECWRGRSVFESLYTAYQRTRAHRVGIIFPLSQWAVTLVWSGWFSKLRILLRAHHHNPKRKCRQKSGSKGKCCSYSRLSTASHSSNRQRCLRLPAGGAFSSLLGASLLVAVSFNSIAAYINVRCVTLPPPKLVNISLRSDVSEWINHF